MPIQSRYMAMVDLLMRVPPLFIIDSVLSKSLFTFIIPDFVSFSADAPWLSIRFCSSVMLIISFLVGALLMFFMTTEQLMQTYNFILSSGMIFIAYVWNRHMVLKLGSSTTTHQDQRHQVSFWYNMRTFAINLFLQIGLAYNFNSLRLDQPWFRHGIYTNLFASSLRSLTYFSFLFPSVSKVLALPELMLLKTPIVSLTFPLVEMIAFVVTKLRQFYRASVETYYFNRLLIQNYGIQGYIENQWIRINVPDVLRVFWITRFFYQVVAFAINRIVDNERETGRAYISYENATAISRELLINGCDTVVALLGMTSVVSVVTQNIGLLFAAYVGSENEEGQNMGTVSAILFFILALQTGLTGLHPDMRILRLFRNFCLLSTAILHFVHSMVNPILMSLSASRSTSVKKHFRALSMCAFLVVFPSWLLRHLWEEYSVSTWLMAVTAFSVEVIIKVTISLLVYTLFMVDAYRDVFWEALDDYVYYLRATGSSIEFLFGIFLFGNGFWIMVFESGGTIRAIMMCIHAYFNIWVQAKEGWKVFKRRRTAVNKINSLPCATSQQIHSHNDVCAICYQELQSARITRCHHFFHGVCLRKWLYVQDRCPLCHEVIYKTDDEFSNDEEGDDVRDLVQNNNRRIMNVPNGIRHRAPVIVEDNRLNNVDHEHQD
ncbi:protein TRC8 homolog [Tubulanus polymorphus]|uniref:protein TRC8 homolog n=1 Tax=Tubulanus polymorphus TaxID=672921 RepID=UPI003DA3E4E7